MRYRIGHLFGDSDLLSEEINQSRRHVSIFTLKALIRLLKIHKFAVVDVKGAPIKLPDYMNFPSPLIKTVKVIDRIISLFPSLSPQIIVEVRKCE